MTYVYSPKRRACGKIRDTNISDIDTKQTHAHMCIHTHIWERSTNPLNMMMKQNDCWQKIIKLIAKVSQKNNSYTFKPQASRKEFSWFLPLRGLSNSFSDILFLYKFCSDFSLVLLVVWVFLCLSQAYLCYPDLDLFPFLSLLRLGYRVNCMACRQDTDLPDVCVCMHMVQGHVACMWYMYVYVFKKSLNSHQGQEFYSFYSLCHSWGSQMREIKTWESSL